MRQDLTDITLVVDRSGSMSATKADAEGGINALINDQKQGAGEALLTLVQFDNNYEFVHNAVNVKDVPPYTLMPRGNTALLDAVGRAITETGERLSKLPEDQRPANVVFVIVTDGQENASREFKLDKIKEMITHQTDVYKWVFQFIGADASTFEAGASMGVSHGNVAQYNAVAPAAAYNVASSKLRGMRSMSVAGASQEELSAGMAFNDDERKAMAEAQPSATTGANV